MAEPIDNVVRPEVFFRALRVNETCRLETAFHLFIEHEWNAPSTFGDGLTTTTTTGPPCGSPFGTAQAREPFELEAELCFSLELVFVLDRFRRFGRCVEEGLLQQTLRAFEQHKDAIYTLYRAQPQLDEEVLEKTIEYFRQWA